MTQYDPQVVTMPAVEMAPCPAIVGAVNALTYITQPDVWPVFLAWAAAQNGGRSVITTSDTEVARLLVRGDDIVHILRFHPGADLSAG